MSLLVEQSRTVMGHDTGSTSLYTFNDEIHLLLNPAGFKNLFRDRIPVMTAAGIVNQFFLQVFIRVIIEDHQFTLLDWRASDASPRPGPNAVRLSYLSFLRLWT